MTNKCKRAIAGVMAVATLVVSGIGVTASANQVVGSYSTFIWTSTSAKTVNNTNTSRIVTSSVTVYKDGTGTYVIAKTANNTGGNSAYCSTSVSSSTYPSSAYNYRLYGSIYNSNNYNSGVAESFTRSAT